MKLKFTLFLLFGLLLVPASNARVYLGAPFKGSIVIQQNADVAFWGAGRKGDTITITSSWSTDTVKCRVGMDGKWRTHYHTPAATWDRQSMRFRDTSGSSTGLYGIYIGEVWIASGQSNMEFPVNGWGGSPSLDKDSLVAAAAKYDGKIKIVTIPEKYNRYPQDSTAIKWQNCTSSTVGTFSCVGFVFASMLSDSLNVPVGIINASYGGSSVEAWCSRETIESFGNITINDATFTTMNQRVPTVNYNGLIKPIEGYTARGFIWYQGEANANQTTYARRFSTMIRDWRKAWGNQNMPFYYAELAPYADGNVNGTTYPIIREQQHQVQHMLPLTRVVGLNDCVLTTETNQIHPGHKVKVGRRMAACALHDIYGYDKINPASPELVSYRFKDGKAYLKFSNAEDGFNRQSGITGFEIGSDNSDLTTATASVEGDEVVVSASSVSNPTKVRYCYRNWQLSNLKNKAGLPVLSFRTDGNLVNITTDTATVLSKQISVSELHAGDAIILEAASTTDAKGNYFNGTSNLQSTVDANSTFVLVDAGKVSQTGHQAYYLMQQSSGQYVAAQYINNSNSNPKMVSSTTEAHAFTLASAADSSATNANYTPAWNEKSVCFTCENFNTAGKYAGRFLINRWASGKASIASASYRDRNAWNIYSITRTQNSARPELAAAIAFASQTVDHYTAGTDPGFAPESYLEEYTNAIADGEAALLSDQDEATTKQLADKIYSMNLAIDSNLVPVTEGYYNLVNAYFSGTTKKAMCDNGNGTLSWGNLQANEGKFLFKLRQNEAGLWYLQCVSTKNYVAGPDTTGLTVPMSETQAGLHAFTRLYNGQWNIVSANCLGEYTTNATNGSSGRIYDICSSRYGSISSWYLRRVTDESIINAAILEGISPITVEEPQIVNVYSLDGKLVRRNVRQEEATKGLTHGVYIVGKKKVVVK